MGILPRKNTGLIEEFGDEIESNLKVYADDSDDVDNEPDDNDDDDLSISSITPTIQWSKFMILVVLAIGLGGGTAFLVLGIQAAHNTEDVHFETQASHLVKDFVSTVQEYEVAARSVHNACRRRETTRFQFRQFYEYLTSGGLEVAAAQCVFNISHQERPAYEAEAKAFYEEYYPTINYTGFKGFIVTDEPEMKISLGPVANDAPFYFPVHYSEPVLPNAAALGLDTYSHPIQRHEINWAIKNQLPVLGGRLKVVQEKDFNAYSVIIRHPGIALAEDDYERFHVSNDSTVRELGNIVIRIPSLLNRHGKEQKESMACYLYDASPTRVSIEEGDSPIYLGSAEYQTSIANGIVDVQVLFPTDEVEYDQVLRSYDSSRIFEMNIAIASGTWKLVVTPINGDETFVPAIGNVIFGGVMIYVVTIALVIFLWRNMQQVQAIHRAKNEAEAERKIIAGLYPKHVMERLLEDEKDKQLALKQKARNKGKVLDGKTTDGSYKIDSVNGNVPCSVLASMRQGDSDDVDNTRFVYGSKPIAEMYPHTTIMFADMVGFTKWSTTREPTQVFTLLETVYHSFDLVARRRRVFKVETVGDCYVGRSQCSV